MCLPLREFLCFTGPAVGSKTYHTLSTPSSHYSSSHLQTLQTPTPTLTPCTPHCHSALPPSHHHPHRSLYSSAFRPLCSILLSPQCETQTLFTSLCVPPPILSQPSIHLPESPWDHSSHTSLHPPPHSPTPISHSSLSRWEVTLGFTLCGICSPRKQNNIIAQLNHKTQRTALKCPSSQTQPTDLQPAHPKLNRVSIFTHHNT